jgi:hypothetical protein
VRGGALYVAARGLRASCRDSHAPDDGDPFISFRCVRQGATKHKEICDGRYQVHSSLLTSQLPVASWHAQIGDPTIADSILDRLVHDAHRIELKGESMRKKADRKSRGE